MLDLPTEWYEGMDRSDLNYGELKFVDLEDRLSLATNLKEALQNYSERDIALELLQQDRIQLSALPEMLIDSYGKPMDVTEIVNAFSKRDLAKILVDSNAEIVRQVRRMRQGGLAGVKASSFPSRATQPHMYDKEGKLHDKYLTPDHEGLEWTNPYTGKVWVVEVNPVPSKDDNGKMTYLDTPSWVASKDKSADIWTPGIIYRKDKLGRPLVSEMTYEEHHGLVVRGKDKKLHQVHCVKKNARGNEDPANCKKTKDGRIILKWGPFEKRLRKYSGVAAMKPEFFTPFGKFTYEQLLSMPMDKVLQMLIVLELIEKKGGAFDGETEWEQNFLKQGMVPPGSDPNLYETGPDGMLTRVALQKVKKSRLTRDQKAVQEKYFRAKGVERCPIRRPHRCYSEAYSMPGLCVSDTKKCYSKKYNDQYKTHFKNQYGFNTDNTLPKSIDGGVYASERDMLIEQNEILRNMINVTAGKGGIGPSIRDTKVSAATRAAQKNAADRAYKAALDKASNAKRLANRYK
jgi:hypothetical protein